ncbi:MAG: 50S ribosome-binding GTPase [Candidatus Aenigmarchaeota archaeon]|nr:50S ribosome-binding GTPase [Candidatus Aenigmarchaeota archaeon]
MVLHHLRRWHASLKKLLAALFKTRGDLKIGLYGPVNSGKTTLANAICMDFTGEKLGKVSQVPHETREIQSKEHVEMKVNGKQLTFNLVDTPGIATKIDFEDFLKYGMTKKAAKQRAKEATKGVIESIKWLDRMDLVLVVMDSAEDPVDQVNVTILGNLEARNIPVIIVANKLDVKNSNAHRIRQAFPQYPTIGISAKTGYNMEELYKTVLKTVK